MKEPQTFNPTSYLQKPRKGRMRRRAGTRINDRPGNVREPSERFGLRSLSQAFPALRYATVHQKKSDGSCRIVELEVWCEFEASFLLLVALSIYTIYTLSNALFFSYSKKKKKERNYPPFASTSHCKLSAEQSRETAT